MRNTACLAFLPLFWLCVGATLAGPSAALAPVRIEGYGGEAMEPFVSRDGQFLFFNNRNDPPTETDIHFARRQDDLTFLYLGILMGTQSRDLDGVPTMSRDGRFCFVSPRDYRQTLNSVFCGRFDGRAVIDVAPQVGLKSERLGRLIFDVEISADGNEMIFAEGTFSGGAVPDAADLFAAERNADGFVRRSDSAAAFAKINTSDLEYAPALSADGLTLYFTRLTGFWPFRQTHIYRAARASPRAPFGEPQMLPIDGFVEGPTISPDGRSLYFHKLVDGLFSIRRLKL